MIKGRSKYLEVAAISWSCSSGDVVYFGGGFENVENKRLELIVPAFEQFFSLQQPYIDSVFFKQVKHLYQNNRRNDDEAGLFVKGVVDAKPG